MSKTFKGRPVVAGTINKGEAVVSHNGVNTLATFQKTALMHDIPIIGKDEVIGSDQNNPDVFGKNLTRNDNFAFEQDVCFNSFFNP